LTEARLWNPSAGSWDEEDTLLDDTTNNNDGTYYRTDAGEGNYEWGILFPSVTYNILEWDLESVFAGNDEEILELGDVLGGDMMAVSVYGIGSSPYVQLFIGWNGYAGTDSVDSGTLSGGEVIRIEFDASAKTIELFVDDVSQGTVDASYFVDTSGWTTFDDIGTHAVVGVEIYYGLTTAERHFTRVSGNYDAGLT